LDLLQRLFGQFLSCWIASPQSTRKKSLEFSPFKKRRSRCAGLLLFVFFGIFSVAYELFSSSPRRQKRIKQTLVKTKEERIEKNTQKKNLDFSLHPFSPEKSSSSSEKLVLWQKNHFYFFILANGPEPFLLPRMEVDQAPISTMSFSSSETKVEKKEPTAPESNFSEFSNFLNSIDSLILRIFDRTFSHYTEKMLFRFRLIVLARRCRIETHLLIVNRRNRHEISIQ
jgi:hypothetical protein